MDVLQRRKAMAEALSAHDTLAVMSFLHPSFVVRGADGVAVIHCEQLRHHLPAFFNQHPEYRQSVESEVLAAGDETVKLFTRRTEIFRGLWRTHHVSSEWEETWKKMGEHWVLFSESPSPRQS